MDEFPGRPSGVLYFNSNDVVVRRTCASADIRANIMSLVKPYIISRAYGATSGTARHGAVR